MRAPPRILVSLLTAAAAACGGGSSGDTPPGPSGPTPQLDEEFAPWTGVTSPDGVWRIAGPWTATGGNLFLPANGQLVSSLDGQAGGYLLLTVNAGVLQGGEIQTVGADYGYGYYEVRMKVTDVPGVCASFFWIGKDYGPGEIDIEFLTDEAWIGSASQGQVHYTVHPDWSANGTAWTQPLAFNPSKAFHRYGFLWTEERLDYTVDGAIVKTFTDPPAANLAATEDGYIMMNTWTGSAGWGGGPPTEDATTAYDWVKYYPGATSVPED